MRQRAVFRLIVLVLAAGAVSGCAKKEEPKTAPPAAVPAESAAEGKALFERKCGVCHAPERALVRPETRERWAEIIREMRARRSDWISDEEAAKILDYLAAARGK